MKIIRNTLLAAILLGGHSAYAAEVAPVKFSAGHWVSKWYLENKDASKVLSLEPFVEVDFAACGTSMCGRIVKDAKCGEISMVLTRDAAGTWGGTWKTKLKPMDQEAPFEEFDVKISFTSADEMIWQAAGYPSLVRRSLGFSTELVRKDDSVCAPAA